jgi:nucleoside-diphosphate-sugar epimerase
MRAFVAGASGAIGTRLVPRLIDREHDVIGASTTPVVNLLDPAAERRARAHAIVHQATALANVCFSGRLERQLRAPVPDRRRRRLRRLVHLAGQAAVVMGTDACGASNAKTKRELGWALRPAGESASPPRTRQAGRLIQAAPDRR